MSDTSWPSILHYGTNAERLAFTPDPPASGQPLYIWYETDTGDSYTYDTSWHLLASSGGGGISQLTGDVTAGPGAASQVATIANDAVTNAKRANMAQSTISGRAAGAGTGDPTDLTPAQVRTIIYNGAMVKKSADQTGANYTTATALAFDAETYDDGGWHDNAVNNTRLTVPSGVTRVDIAATVRLVNVTAGLTGIIEVRKNGSADFNGFIGIHQLSAFVSRSMNICGIGIPCAAGDYFELFLQVETDTSVDVIAVRTTFSIRAVYDA